MKSYVKKQLIRMRVYLIFDGIKRTEYIKKKNLFYSVGSNFFFQPRILPSDPKLIKFGNNVTVASNVTFINHDLIYRTLNFLNNGKYYNYYAKPIEIGDNVFIGSNSTILPAINPIHSPFRIAISYSSSKFPNTISSSTSAISCPFSS